MRSIGVKSGRIKQLEIIGEIESNRQSTRTIAYNLKPVASSR